MEFIAILIGGLVGWQNGTLGRRELQVMALVIAGWTAAETANSVPYLTLDGFVFSLVAHTVLVTVPYALGVLVNRLSRRTR